MKRTLPKLVRWRYGIRSIRFIFYSSHRGNTQPLFDPFIRPMSRADHHKKIKEFLKAREPPHPRFFDHMRTVITANGLTKKQHKRRTALVRELSVVIKARFGEDMVDVVDISMNNYGVSVHQAPCELAVVDLRNPYGLPMGTSYAKLPKTYSIKKVLEAVKRHSPDASLAVYVKDWRFLRALDLSGVRVITEEYTLSMPSPLHEARRELVKAYCDHYPIFGHLLNLVTIFHYCIKSAAFEPLALAYHVLTFFLIRYQVPSYVEQYLEHFVSKKSMENDTKLGKRFKVAHINDRGVVRTRLVDTLITPKWAMPTTVDTIADGLPVTLGTKGFKLFYGYLKWTLDVDFRANAFNPGRGLVSRFPTDPRLRVPYKTEAKMLVQGLLDREDVLEDHQTLDWESATIVVQDPFFPWENISPRVSEEELNRIRNMAEVVLAQLDNGKDLATAIESILHPNVKPPIMPGFMLESNLDRPPKSSPVAVTAKSRYNSREVDEKSKLGEEDEEYTGALSTDSIPSTSQSGNVVRTPKDLEGSLFR